MNPELRALYKRFPWLLQLHPTIEKAHVIGTKVLDMQSISRLCGTLPVANEYTVTGYLFSNGQILREVYEPDSIYGVLFKKIKHFFKKYPPGPGSYISLVEVLRTYRDTERVTHVVFYGRDIFAEHGGLELTVYELHNGKSMKEMLADFEHLHHDTLSPKTNTNDAYASGAPV